MELRQKTNRELFVLYDGELVFHHRSERGLHEAKRILGHFHNYLGEYPPTPELAKSFLAKFSNRKPATIARYAAVLKVFLKWYGEELDINIRVPKILPSYVEKTDIEKLLEAMRAKRKLTRRLKHLAGKHGFTYNRVFIRNQKTRWGSCSHKNNISLNMKIIRLPEELMDYVILHELAHTRVKDHSNDFWSELNRLVGNGKGMASRLREYGVGLLQ